MLRGISIGKFGSFGNITGDDYPALICQRLREDFGALNAPELEGITLDGRLAVIYSRFDLGNGWEQFPHAYSYGLKDESALQIGTNVIVYAVTH